MVEEGRAGRISPSSLKSPAWFPAPPPEPPKAGIGSALVKLGIGAAVGGLFFASDHRVIAYVVWAIAGSVGMLSIVSAAAREVIDGALARFGRWLGTGVGHVLLGAIYLIVVTPTRMLRRLLGADDLHLRDRDRHTYWLAADRDERKVRWVGSMFATEALTGRSGHSLRNVVIALAAVLLLAEGVLRTQGFGTTVLYVADPVVGYYPAPHTDVVRYGGRVTINAYGMRSPEVEVDKPPETFRLFMIGDSTLYGGSYIDQERLYSRLVEHKLNALSSRGRVEVLAIGVNGWGPFHERGYVKRFGTFGADLAVIHLPLDDVVRPHYGLMAVPFFPADSPPRLGLEEVANHLMWRYRKVRAGRDHAWEDRQSQLGIAEYGRLADDLHEAIPEVFAAILPTIWAGIRGEELDDERRWRAQLEASFAEHGAVATYYPMRLFADQGDADALYHDDYHLEERGHAIYADFLVESLIRDSKALRSWLEGAKR
jgi:GDSL-like Lipase/Acylhydrolase family